MTNKDRHFYNMGIIGNCSYNALIDDQASIQWMCWPKFDSSFIFGSLLDKNKGGRFSINCLNENYTTKQEYLTNTNILTTTFESDSGTFKVTDFAPRFDNFERIYKPNMLIRKIEPINGTPRLSVSCKPVGGYGEIIPEEQQGSNHLRYVGLDKRVRLSSNLAVNYIMEEHSFVLSSTKYLILTWGVPLEGSIESVAEEFLRQTIKYWHDWVLSCTIEPTYQKEVIRSALALKIHQYEDTGAVIASATMALPEHHTSGRNWDYRYCWMRDSFYTLQALNQIGHFEEIKRYSEYIENLVPTKEGRYNPVYTILGDENFVEEILDLDGYLENKPVRVGNQAKEHIQNDVYGQILVALMPAFVDERYLYGDDSVLKSTKLIYKLLEMIEKTMDEPDAGLWEFRNKSQKHCYTFLFHWAGAKAAVKIARLIKDDAMESHALKLVNEASRQIEKCYNEEMGVYTQAIGTTNLDASLLQLISMKYLDPRSEKAKKHLKAMEERLKTPEGLFFRYKHEDDFGEPENTFLVCSFWYVEALACVGRVEEAKAQLDIILSYSNHLGLFAEDVHAPTGSQWGNFPQTYSHVGLMNSVSKISRYQDLPNFF